MKMRIHLFETSPDGFTTSSITTTSLKRRKTTVKSLLTSFKCSWVSLISCKHYSYSFLEGRTPADRKGSNGCSIAYFEDWFAGPPALEASTIILSESVQEIAVVPSTAESVQETANVLSTAKSVQETANVPPTAESVQETANGPSTADPAPVPKGIVDCIFFRQQKKILLEAERIGRAARAEADDVPLELVQVHAGFDSPSPTPSRTEPLPDRVLHTPDPSASPRPGPSRVTPAATASPKPGPSRVTSTPASILARPKPRKLSREYSVFPKKQKTSTPLPTSSTGPSTYFEIRPNGDPRLEKFMLWTWTLLPDPQTAIGYSDLQDHLMKGSQLQQEFKKEFEKEMGNPEVAKAGAAVARMVKHTWLLYKQAPKEFEALDRIRSKK